MKKILFMVMLSITALLLSAQKYTLSGLICRDYNWIEQNPKFQQDSLLKVCNGVVAKAYWYQLQPVSYGQVIHPNAIDTVIAWSKAFELKYKIKMPVKIRVYCGLFAPPDLKKSVGTIQYQDKFYAKFWELGYIRAYSDLMLKLSVYDTVNVVAEVVNAATVFETAEPFIRPFSNFPQGKKFNILFMNNGYTRAKDSVAIMSSFNSMLVWHNTKVSTCFTPYNTITDKGVALIDTSITKKFIDVFVSKLGKLAVIGNNGLRDQQAKQGGKRFSIGGDYFSLYDYLSYTKKTKGVQLYFQTASTAKGSEMHATLDQAVYYAANYLEMPEKPGKWLNYLSFSDLIKYDNLIK